MVQKEWAERAPGRKKLACFVMEGESGHSNCFVDNERLVIFDSMFEHVRERHHMMSIIRHEMGHELFKHVAWIVLYRIIYYDVILVGFIFLVKYKQDWLA